MLTYLSFASALPTMARCLLHTEKKNCGRMDITSELAEGGEGSLDQIKTTTKERDLQYIPFTPIHPCYLMPLQMP
jgi:hypothetical protein